MLCVDEGLLEKKKKKRKKLGRTVFSADRSTFQFIGKVFEEKCLEKKKEKNNAARAKNTKLWVNKKMRSGGFEATLPLDFCYLSCYLSVRLVIESG